MNEEQKKKLTEKHDENCECCECVGHEYNSDNGFMCDVCDECGLGPMIDGAVSVGQLGGLKK
jgi:hypothetical protein